MKRRWVVALVLGVIAPAIVPVVHGLVPVVPSVSPGRAEAATVTSTFVPVVPCRLLDTRQQPGRRVAAGSTTTVQVSGRCGVDQASRAASLTITATDGRAVGYATLHPAGSPRPEASAINFRTGSTVANSAVVTLSASGAVQVFSSAEVHLVVDVAGAFEPATGQVRAGRFRATTPTRLLDTRTTGGRGAGDLVLPLPASVPDDAVALAVSMTIVDSSGPTYLTVHPAGTRRPNASVVNTDTSERTRAVTVLAPVSPGGLIIHRSATTDVIVDMSGWFTGRSAPASTEGLFVAQTARRMWDSRRTADPVHPGGTVERPVVDVPAAAAVVNVTVLDATRAGYVTAHPAGTPRPTASVLNVTWRDPLAAMTVVPLSSRGVAIHASSGVHVLLDVTGWFTGAPQSASGPRPANTAPAFGGNVLFVSDSSLAGIRWQGALGWFQGANIIADLESCRRLIGVSCRGREGYAPTTALQAVWRTPGIIDTLVIGTGYNDYASTFPYGFDAVVAAARGRGIQRIVWLTYREAVTYRSPEQASNALTFAANNATLRAKLATGAYPEVTIADWNAYSSPRREWFTYDGVHVTGSGPRAAAEYISRTLAFLDRRACPVGLGGPVAPGGWCAAPDLVGSPW